MFGLMARGRRRFRHVLDGDRHCRLGVERETVGEQLVENDADRVEVRSRADGVTLCLLRREVLRGAHDRSRLSHVRRPGAGDPEVRDLGVVGVVDDHVVGLQITVDHPPAVGEAGGLENLDRDVDRPDRVQRGLLADQLLERATRQVLHRDVEGAVVGAAVVDADDVRVLKSSGRLRLATKALDEPGSSAKRRCRSLSATLRPSCWSSARNTSAMPPAPRRETTL